MVTKVIYRAVFLVATETTILVLTDDIFLKRRFRFIIKDATGHYAQYICIKSRSEMSLIKTKISLIKNQ